MRIVSFVFDSVLFLIVTVLVLIVAFLGGGAYCAGLAAQTAWEIWKDRKDR